VTVNALKDKDPKNMVSWDVVPHGPVNVRRNLLPASSGQKQYNEMKAAETFNLLLIILSSALCSARNMSKDNKVCSLFYTSCSTWPT
jgi:hypothetical protein